MIYNILHTWIVWFMWCDWPTITQLVADSDFAWKTLESKSLWFLQLRVIFWEQVHGSGLVQRHRWPAHTATVSEAPWCPPRPPPILGPVSARLSPACLVSRAHPLRNGWLPNARRIEVTWNLLRNEYIIWQNSCASSIYRTCLGQVCRW